jgi:peptidoglycan/LPS O-acetylase OafA/YrhL
MVYSVEPALNLAPAAAAGADRPAVALSGAQARLPGLDALRAVAALCVVVMHVGAIYPGAPRVVGAAYLAVDFFFLLSGFVMARTYEARMRSGAIGPWRFLAARYRRLWPSMAIGALLSVPFLWRDFPDLPVFIQTAVPNLLLLPGFAVPVLFGLNTPAWSVFFELVANLGHGLALHRLGNRALVALTALFLAALVGCGLRFGDLDLGSRASNFGGGLARVGFSYCLGVLCWRLHGNRAPLPVPPVLALLAMPLLFALASRAALEGWAFDLAFIALAGPLLLWGGLNWQATTGPLRGAAFAAGALSFPLYAVHYPVLLGVEAAGLPIWAAPPLALLAALATTAVTGGLRALR